MSQDVFREEPRGALEGAIPTYRGLALVRTSPSEEDTTPELLLVDLHNVPSLEPSPEMPAVGSNDRHPDYLQAPDLPAKKQAKISKIGRLGLRAAGGLLTVAAVAAPPLAGIAAVAEMPPAHTSVVGLDATATVEIGQDNSRLDTGLLGSISSPAHHNFLGVNIGMNVAVQGDGVDLGDSTTRNALGEILSRPQPEIDRIVGETTVAARDRFLLEGGKVLAIEAFAGVLYFGGRRFFGPSGELLANEKQRQFYQWVAKPVVAGVFALHVIGPVTAGVEQVSHQQHANIVADPSLENTGLKGFQIKGPLADAIPTLINGFQPSEALNDLTAKNAQELVASRPDLQPQEGWTTWLQADDLQDRSSMAQQVGVLAKALGVKYIMMTGDWSTISQLGFGSYLMDTVNHYSGGIETLTMGGDHDTKLTSYYADLAGFVTANNKTQEIGGMKVLALNSFQISTLGVDGIPTEPRDPAVTEQTWIDDAVNEIKDTDPQVVAMHDYKAAIKLAKAAIIAGHPIPFIDAGRSFEQLGPITVRVPGHKDETVIFVSGSTGAHDNTSPEFGNIPIKAPANYFMRNDTTGEVKVVTFTYHPDGSVTASDPRQIVPPQDENQVSAEGTKQTDHKDEAAKVAAVN